MWLEFYICFFFFKQKTAYEMRISDWSSDVCSSDLRVAERERAVGGQLDDEAFGEWFDAVVLIVFFRFDGLAADGDDGALHRGARRADEFGVGVRSLHAIGTKMRHDVGADEDASDRKRSDGVEAEEYAGEGDGGRTEMCRAKVAGGKRWPPPAQT